MYPENSLISSFDPDLWQAVNNETIRQEQHIELIASENYVSPGVLALQGSILTNKYAEGYPGKRYYGGCQFVDAVENLAIDRVKTLFKADYANVQPHSGSQANCAAILALVKPGDTILGMSLDQGGHLTHGAKVSFSGQLFNAIPYGILPTTGELDYNQVLDLAKQHKPKLIIAGFSAYSRIVDWSKFREIADLVGAYLLVDIAHVAGLIAAGLYPSPINVADVVTSTTHKTLRGPRGGLILARSNPTIEKKLNSAIFPGIQGGALMHVIAAKALAFKEALLPEFTQYCQQIIDNARSMSKVMLNRGYEVLSGGTDNHMFLLNLLKTNKDLSGQDASNILGLANITVNKNSVPHDPRSPMLTSGIRIGTPAITTRGFKSNQANSVANWIADLLDDLSTQNKISEIKQAVLELCKKFPVYAASQTLISE
ncbi:MAG: serine hydroxymethyltransferase [Gammaproteobacteria bacterium]|jgi:glycine hydroxymethyltransferase